VSRYQKIHSQIWHDEKFIELSNDGRILFFYILTSPHNNSLGLYILPVQYALADLGWDRKRLDKPFKELIAKGFILYDDKVRLICIKNHLKHNMIENENQAKSAVKILASLPKSSLYLDILELLRKPFHKPLLELLREQYAKPEEKEKEVSGTETGTGTGTEVKGGKPPKLPYGEFQNVLLTDIELEKLHERFGKEKTSILIERLSSGIASHGYKYESHYATILTWEKREIPQGKSPPGAGGNLRMAANLELAKEMIQDLKDAEGENGRS